MKLCIFTFSPVQSFISQSRKLSDLFNASFILSYLTERLIEEIGKSSSVVYPSYKKELKNTDLAGYPNRLVILTDDGEGLCERMKSIFENTWEEICSCVFSTLGISGRGLLQFQKHVSGYFQSFCHCMEFINKEKWLTTMGLEEVAEAEDYGYTYDLLERYLGALKSFRGYEGKIDYDTYAGKYPDGCSLCGERPALALDWESLRRRKKHMLSRSERLCGVCLTKRFAVEYFESVGRLKRKSFPSTKDLAFIHLKERLIRDKQSGINLEYIRAIEHVVSLIMDKQDLSIENINADWLDPQEVRSLMQEAEQEEKKQYEELLVELERLYDKQGGGYNRPKNAYFGILMMDGDNMGAWLGLSPQLRGEKLSEDFHRTFSEKLSDYAKHVYEKAQTEKPFVELVYAGGDDVLAVGFPTRLLDFAKQIKEAFSQFLSSERATASAGLVVGHSSENLSFLLEEVRRAEKQAKNKGRDRICISVVPRNSQPVRIVLRWKDLALFEEIVSYFRNELISQGLPYALQQELWVFKGDQKPQHTDLIKALLRRALMRKSKLEDRIDSLIEALQQSGFLEDISSLEALFYVARFVSRLEEKNEAVCV